MLNNLARLAILCSFFCLSCQAAYSQTLKADYQFQGNLNSSVAGAPAMTDLTGSGGPNSFVTDTVDGYTRQTLRFPFNSGVAVNVNGVIPFNTYTIVGLFRFDQVSGPRRVAGSDPNDDFGAYIVDGRLEFESTANAAFFPNTYIQIVVVREANGTVRAYRDGTLRVTAPDPDGDFIIDTGILRLFQDDINLPTEATAGNVARIRLYDAPMTTAQVQALERVPNVGGGEQPILFYSTRDGNNEIYTMNVDGSNQKRLTFNEVAEFSARWSPDKTKIVYTRRETSTSVLQIWVMNADGSGQTRLTNTTTNDQNPNWKPDSTKILFSRCTTAGVCDLFTMNPDGTGQAAIPNGINTSGDEDQAAYSPDGTKIIFVGATSTFTNPNICTANADGSSRQNITNTSSPIAYFYPVYSPDGNKIAVDRRSNSADQFTSEIYVMESNGSNQTNLTNNTFFESSPQWSPDGSRLAFSSQRESVFVEAYTMNATNGSSAQRLTVNSVADVPTNWYNPATGTGITRRAPYDFDGDGKTDISIFRPSNGEWWYQQSGDNVVKALTFGVSTDKITPGDYDGDRKADIAFFRPSTGEWFVLRSSNLTFFAAPFGTSTDKPAPGDFDGDGKTDFAVFRPSNATWFILRTSDMGVQTAPFGSSTDIPTVADYDGDGKSDIAIYRPAGGSGGEWWILRSSNGSVFATPFGLAMDKPVQGDYTGDGKADCAFFRPSTGTWYVLRSDNLTFYAAPFGANGDTPVPGDYDGDGKYDFGVFRPSAVTWFINKSTGGVLIQGFGAIGDIPVPSAYVP